MATGHILPGYGQPVSRLRRARSAGCYPLDNSTLLELKQKALASRRELDSIKENAKCQWMRNTTQPTTYDSHFSGGEVTEITTARPTSSHRHNNPHPPMVFLTNRLHYIEGMQNADVRLGKSVYRIDASVKPSELDRRRAPREKFVARPDTALINQYKDPFGFRRQLPPRQAQAAEAWVKLADDQDRDQVLEAMKENSEFLEGAQSRPRTAIPSLHRFMKIAGAEERDATSRILQTLRTDPAPPTVGQAHQRDVAATARYYTKPGQARGTYSMHPDWPTSIPHHRVP